MSSRVESCIRVPAAGCGTLLALVLLGACAEREPPPPGRRVILVSLDTLRADHLSVYGYGRRTAPNLEVLVAADAALFERAYAQAPWTLPSHMSIFTSLYPYAHGVNEADKRLSPEVVTLTEILRDAGLDTIALTDGAYMAKGYGFEDGFDEYLDDSFGAIPGKGGLERTYPHVERWLSKKRDSSFFLFLHTYDTHAPYAAREPWFSSFLPGDPSTSEEKAQIEYLASLGESSYYELERFEGMDRFVAAYDGMILWEDHVLGRLFAHLRELGIWDDTMIVITSDHGENFLDEGVYAGHGVFLHDAEIRVPLIVKFPGNRFGGQRSGAIVESIDIMPTILAALDVEAPEGVIMQGHDLAALLAGQPDPSPAAYSSHGHIQGESVRTEEWTLVTAVKDEDVDAFIKNRLLPRDEALVRSRIRNVDWLLRPGAPLGDNHLDQQPEVVRQLRQQLRDWHGAQYAVKHLIGHPERRESLSPQAIERLKQLGYF